MNAHISVGVRLNLSAILSAQPSLFKFLHFFLLVPTYLFIVPICSHIVPIFSHIVPIYPGWPHTNRPSQVIRFGAKSAIPKNKVQDPKIKYKPQIFETCTLFFSACCAFYSQTQTLWKNQDAVPEVNDILMRVLDIQNCWTRFHVYF